MLSRSSDRALNSATSRLKKRERTQNWAFEEKRYLLELCKRDMSIIENKRLDADLTALKNRAWKVVHEEFCKVFGNERNCNRLKEQWRRMKACSRSEILDYFTRVSKFGQDIADKKRPSSFTFEIWEFMQNAKRNSCKTGTVQVVDGAGAKQLSNHENASQPDQSSANGNETHILSDDEVNEDDDDLFNWQKTTQNLCEVEIKDESLSNVGGGSHFGTLANANDDNEHVEKSSKRQKRKNDDERSFSPFSSPLATSFDVLNLLRNSSIAANGALGNKYSDEIQLVVEMQAKEHSLRMTILQTQLETAKLNRDIAEINKILLLRNLQNTQD